MSHCLGFVVTTLSKRLKRPICSSEEGAFYRMHQISLAELSELKVSATSIGHYNPIFNTFKIQPIKLKVIAENFRVC